MEIQWLELQSQGAQSALIRIREDEGHFGLGEIAPEMGSVTSETLRLLDACAVQLASIDTRNINVALDAISDITGRDRSAGPAVRSALDMGLHDLNGIRRGVAVHGLLGGAMRTTFTLTEAVQGGQVEPSTRGPDGSLLLICHPGAEDDGAWVSGMVEKSPDHLQIDIDASESFDNPALAKVFVEGLLGQRARLNVALVQPLHEADLLGHADLRASLPLPIVVDRSLRSAGVMAQIVRLGAADRVVANIDRLGGLREAMRVASLAEAAAIGVSAAGFGRTAVGAAAVLHYAAALHDTWPIMMTRFADPPPFRAVQGVERDGDRIRVGEGPGLGVVLPDELLGAFRRVG